MSPGCVARSLLPLLLVCLALVAAQQPVGDWKHYLSLCIVFKGLAFAAVL